MIATGDLVEGGKPEEYARLRRLLAPLAMPVHLIPGNHDARDALRAAFADHAYLPPTGFLQYTVEDLPVRLIALDTLVEGKGHGALCARAARLARGAARPTATGRRCCSCIIRRSTAASTPSTHPPERRRRAPGRAGAPARQCRARGVRPRPSARSRCAGPAPWPRSRPAPPTRRRSTCTTGAPLSMMMEPPGIALHLWRRRHRAGDPRELHRNLRRSETVSLHTMTVAQSRLRRPPQPRRPVQAAGPRRHHRRGRRRSQRHRHLFAGRRPVRLRPAVDGGADLAADGRRAVGQRAHRPRHRPRPRRQHGAGVSAQRGDACWSLLLFVANTINIGADLAAMGAAAKLVLGGGQLTSIPLGFARASRCSRSCSCPTIATSTC